MDSKDVERAIEHLVRWGLIDDIDGDLRPTRKWGAKLQSSAEKLNILQASGAQPQGNPLVLAVSNALANENLTTDDTLFRDCVAALVTLELERMTPEKRARYGFEGVMG